MEDGRKDEGSHWHKRDWRGGEGKDEVGKERPFLRDNKKQGKDNGERVKRACMDTP